MKCKFCGKDKPRDDFPKKLCGRCKECKYEYTREWKAKNRDKVNSADYEWRKANYDKYLESQRKTYWKYIDKRREYGRMLYAKTTKKRGYVQNIAWRNGGAEVISKLKGRPCEKCGTKEDLCIHHKDNKGRAYIKKGLKPNNNLSNLTVLCRRCHSKLHQELKKLWQAKKGEN